MTYTRLSASKVTTHRQCALRHRWAYIDKLYDDQLEELRGAGATGRLTHLALERVYRWIITEHHNGPLGSAAILGRAHATVLDAAANHNPPITDTHAINTAIDMVIDYLADREADFAKILGVEEFVQFTLPQHNIQVVGYADRIEKVTDTSILVIDLKSGAGAPDHGNLSHHLQGKLYTIAVARTYPWATRIGFALHHLRHRVDDRVVRSRAEIKFLEVAVGRELAADLEAMETGPWPPTEGPWCGHCQFAAVCPAKNGDPPEGVYDPRQDQEQP